jgi:hypothetical protein
MPECRRCARVLATCELRRTTLGYVCKPGWLGDRCVALTRERREQEHGARPGKRLRPEESK